jgi:hypothetical protein
MCTSLSFLPAFSDTVCFPAHLQAFVCGQEGTFVTLGFERGLFFALVMESLSV